MPAPLPLLGGVVGGGGVVLFSCAGGVAPDCGAVPESLGGVAGGVALLFEPPLVPEVSGAGAGAGAGSDDDGGDSGADCEAGGVAC
ncbi:MAG: hypothetical protein ACRET1_01010 [Burkholderiales bacterium]